MTSSDALRARVAELERENATLRGRPAAAAVTDSAGSGYLGGHLDLILGAFPNLIFLIDPADRIVECRMGRGALPLVPPERFLGHRVADALPPDVAARLVAELAEARSRGENVLVEYELPADGVDNHYQAHLVPLADGYVAAVVFDVSHHRRTELALRRQEEQYRRIVETAQEGIWTLDAGGRTTYANARMAEILGYRTYEMLGAAMSDFVDREARGAADECLEAGRRGVAERRELRLRHRSGRAVWTLVATSPLRDAGGRFIGVLAMVTDVTERRRMEEAVRAGEARYRAIIESEPECVKLLDRQGRLVEMNPAGLAMLEVDSVAAAANLLRFVEEPDRDRFVQLHRAVMHGGTGELEFRVVGARGTRRWLHTVAVPLRAADGSVDSVLGITRDVTRSREAEEQLRRQAEMLQTVFDHIPVVLVLVDPSGRIELVNQECERRLGWTAADLRGAEPLAPLQAPDAGTALGELFRSGRPGWTDLRTQARDGRTVEMRWAVVRMSDGRTIGIGQDVSEVRRLEAQAWQAQKLESIGRLAGGVAHDFNNLLTAILGYAELLQQRLPPEGEVRDDLDQIAQAGRRARDLTAQLLAFGRRQVLAPRRLDLNRLVVDLSRLFERLLGEHVRIRTDLLPTLWAIEADAAQLEQVLMNLALNARDAMPQGGELVITTRNRPAAGGDRRGAPDQVELTVHDTGQGMTEEALEHLFEPFYTTKERGRGTGLGLPTVYGIVKQSGGQVSVTSAPGAGTTFTITLPRARERAEAEPPALPPRAQDPGGRERVLVVEDEPGVRALTVRALREVGYAVEAAESGAAAIALVERLAEPLDLLIADVVMPEVSGRQVADALQRRFPRAACLYVSGYTSDVIGDQGVLDSGMNFLQKPYTPSSLRAKVREVLAARVDAAGDFDETRAASGS